jgi:hypothetical protein
VPEIGLLGSEGGATSSVVPTPIPAIAVTREHDPTTLPSRSRGSVTLGETRETTPLQRSALQRRQIAVHLGAFLAAEQPVGTDEAADGP